MIDSSVSPQASPHPKHPANPTTLSPLKSPPPLLDPQLQPPPSLRLKPSGATTTKAHSTIRCKSIITPASNSQPPLHISSLIYSTKNNYKHNQLQHNSAIAYSKASPLSNTLNLSAIHTPVRILPRERKPGKRFTRLRRSKIGKCME